MSCITFLRHTTELENHSGCWQQQSEFTSFVFIYIYVNKKPESMPARPNPYQTAQK